MTVSRTGTAEGQEAFRDHAAGGQVKKLSRDEFNQVADHAGVVLDNLGKLLRIAKALSPQEIEQGQTDDGTEISDLRRSVNEHLTELKQVLEANDMDVSKVSPKSDYQVRSFIQWSANASEAPQRNKTMAQIRQDFETAFAGEGERFQKAPPHLVPASRQDITTRQTLEELAGKPRTYQRASDDTAAGVA